MSIFKNKSRMITIGVSITLVLVAYAVVMALPSANPSVNVDPASIKGELVEVIYPQPSLIEQTYTATGKLQAFDRFEIFAQVEGQLLPSTRHFREGNSYSQGDIILEIDRREYEMTLMAQKSDFITLITSVLPDLKSDYADSYPVWRAYVSAVDVTKSIPTLPAFASEQEKFYLAGKGIPSKYYNILSAEEKLDKYTIRAPFSGVITTASVEAGTAVRNGSALGTMISNSAYDLEITAPLALLQNIQVGTIANLTSSEIAGEWSGKVVRIGGDIDVKTQSVKLFIRTSGKNLKEGMYLTAELIQKPFENAISLPRKLIDDQNRLFVVQGGQLEQVTVNILSRQGDVAVIDGLPEGAAVLSTVVKSAYAGKPVRIADK